MPGVPGSGGSPPKRSTQRRNKSAGPVDAVLVENEVIIPEANRRWHPVALQWFESLASSGQSEFYESSDWATAYLLAESMSRELRPQPVGVVDGKVVRRQMPPKGASLSAWLRAMTALCVTEGDRRRSRIELVHLRAPVAEDEEAGRVSELDEYRQRNSS